MSTILRTNEPRSNKTTHAILLRRRGMWTDFVIIRFSKYVWIFNALHLELITHSKAQHNYINSLCCYSRYLRSSLSIYRIRLLVSTYTVSIIVHQKIYFSVSMKNEWLISPEKVLKFMYLCNNFLLVEYICKKKKYSIFRRRSVVSRTSSRKVCLILSLDIFCFLQYSTDGFIDVTWRDFILHLAIILDFRFLSL